ncbi:MAG: metal-sulfur cluster assembly factor [bacterium]
MTTDRVWQALQSVDDPEYPLSIVDLGMVYRVEIGEEAVKIAMTFTAMGCPAIEMITEDVREEVGKIEGVSAVQIEIVWSPPWTKDKITEKGRQILQIYGVGV